MNFTTRLEEAKGQPGKLSQLHLEVTSEYVALSDEYEAKLPFIAQAKRQLLEEHKTVSRVNAEYELTELGVWEDQCKIAMKKREKVLATIRQRLNTLSEELKGYH
jgi:hypothetical protein